MKNTYELLDIDLTLFEGGPGGAGAAAPQGAAGGEGGQANATGEGAKPGDADQTSEELKVVYGKNHEVEESNEGETDGQEEKNEGDPKEGEDHKQDEIDYNLDTLLKTNEEVKKQFDQRVQNIINKRFKETKQLEEKVNKVDPVLDLLKERYEVEDTEKLLETLENESYEEIAYRENMSPEQYKRMKEIERENQQLKEKVGPQNSEETDEQVQQRVKQWYDEAEQLQDKYPDFDLREYSAQNADFVRLLKSGVGVEAAYQATNFDNIMNQKLAAATDQAKKNAVESIKNKNNRVNENGADPSQGVIVKSDVKQLTKEDRARIAEMVKNGEEIKF